MKKPKRDVTGDSYLKDIESIEIKLENKQVVRLDMDRELDIPTGIDELRKEVQKSPARYAFWAYQSERALARVRQLENEFAVKEGETDLVHRKHYDNYLGEEYTETMIKSRVAMDREVKVLKGKLNDARKQMGVLRTMRSALDHRCFIIRTLYAQSGEVTKG